MKRIMCLFLMTTFISLLFSQISNILPSNREFHDEWQQAGCETIKGNVSIHEFYNVANYGFINDGTGDNVSQLIGLLYETTEDGISVIYFPGGIYRFQSNIPAEYIKDNTIFKGKGDDLSKIVFDLDTSVSQNAPPI